MKKSEKVKDQFLSKWLDNGNGIDPDHKEDMTRDLDHLLVISRRYPYLKRLLKLKNQVDEISNELRIITDEMLINSAIDEYDIFIDDRIIYANEERQIIGFCVKHQIVHVLAATLLKNGKSGRKAIEIPVADIADSKC